MGTPPDFGRPKRNRADQKKNEEIIKKLDYLMNKNELFEALSKLNDCDKLANELFICEIAPGVFSIKLHNCVIE